MSTSAQGMSARRRIRLVCQACSYMIGELKLIELRDKAKKALGDKFSLRDWHNMVLTAGTLPLDLLERQVDAYIRAAGGKI